VRAANDLAAPEGAAGHEEARAVLAEPGQRRERFHLGN